MTGRFEDEYHKIELCLQKAQDELGEAMHRLAEDMGNSFGMWSHPLPATPPLHPYRRVQAFSDPHLPQHGHPFPFHPPPPMPDPQEWLKPLDLGNFGSDLFPGLPDLGIGFGSGFGFGLNNTTGTTATSHISNGNGPQDQEVNGNNTLPRTRKKAAGSVDVNDGRRASDTGPSGYEPVNYAPQRNSDPQWATFWKQDSFFQPITPPSPASSTTSSSSFSWQQPKRESQSYAKNSYSVNSDNNNKRDYSSNSDSDRPRSNDFSVPSPWQQVASSPWQQSQSEADETPRFPVPPAYTEVLNHGSSTSSVSEMQQEVCSHPEVGPESLWTPPGGKVPRPTQQREIEKWWNGRGVSGSGSSEEENSKKPVKGHHRNEQPRLVIPPPPPVVDSQDLGPQVVYSPHVKCPPNPRSGQGQPPLRTTDAQVSKDTSKISRNTHINKKAAVCSSKSCDKAQLSSKDENALTSGNREVLPPGGKDNTMLARPDLLPPPEICTSNKSDLDSSLIKPIAKHGQVMRDSYHMKNHGAHTKNLKNITSTNLRKSASPDIPRKPGQILPDSKCGMLDFSCEDSDDDTEEGRSTESDSGTERAEDSSTEVETETETEDDDKYPHKLRDYHIGGSESDSVIQENSEDIMIKISGVPGLHDGACNDPTCFSGQFMCDGRCTDPNCIMVWHEPVRTLPRKVSLRPSMPVIIEDVPRSSDEDEGQPEKTVKKRPDNLILPEIGEYHSLERQVSRGTDRSISLSSSTSLPSTPVSPTPSLLDSMHRKFYPVQDSRSVSAEQLCDGNRNSPLGSFLATPPITHSKSASFVQDMDSNSSTPRVTPERLSDSDLMSINKSKSSLECSKILTNSSLKMHPPPQITPFQLLSPKIKLRRASPASFIPPPPPPAPPTDQSESEAEENMSVKSNLSDESQKSSLSGKSSHSTKVSKKISHVNFAQRDESQDYQAELLPNRLSQSPQRSSHSPQRSYQSPPRSSKSPTQIIRSLSHDYDPTKFQPCVTCSSVTSHSSATSYAARRTFAGGATWSTRSSVSGQSTPTSPTVRGHNIQNGQASSPTSDSDSNETEAVEACKWLRAAGFPQYAQMYEDHQFPIDVKCVEKDHDFLDRDSMQSLYRRLNTLNKWATMREEVPLGKTGEESDEEEQCALSDRWQFQRNIRRWSRKDLEASTSAGSEDDAALDKTGLRSCSSRDSVLTDDENSNMGDHSPILCSPAVHRSTSDESTRSSPPASPQVFPRSRCNMGIPGNQSNGTTTCSAPTSPVIALRAGSASRLVPPTNGDGAHLTNQDSSQQNKEHSWEFPWSPRLRRAASERFKGAKNFLKRMESFKSKKSTRRVKTPPSKLEIGQPVVADELVMREKMDRLGCVDISPSTESSPKLDSHRKTSETSSSFPDNLCISSYDTASSSRSAHHLHNIESTTTDSYHSAGSRYSDSEESWKSLGHKKNKSSSDIVDGIYPLASESKPGSFPKFLAGGFVDMGNGNQVNVRTGSVSQSFGQTTLSSSPRGIPSKTDIKYRIGNRRSQQQESENRLSIYDNVPPGGDDPQKELDLILDDLFQNIQNMQASPPRQMGSSGYTVPPSTPTDSISLECNSISNTVWTQDLPLSQTHEVRTSSISSTHSSHQVDSSSGPPHQIASQSSTGQSSNGTDDGHESHEEDEEISISGSLSNADASDPDTPGSRDEESPEQRERRDSGVGSSLTRAPSDRRRHRIRWHSFVKSHRPSLTSQSLQLWCMSAGQLMVLRKLSLLKVTANMERYCPSNRSGWNWIVPKIMRRWKVPDYKDKHVFGVPLLVVQQRTGQPLPQCMLYAMRCLRRTARDAVGIFRKSGVRSRIQKLRNQLEAEPESIDFESLQAYDVADLLKQYFRELPECLLTNKLSDTFIAIFTHVPTDQRLEVLQAAVMLLPDENRHVLQSLLLFLGDMAQHAAENQMNASNLAVCFAPSLFHIYGIRHNPAASPKWGRRQPGIPDNRELQEQKAAHECLTTMITECKKIFMVPEDMLSKCRLSYIELGDPVSIEELGKRSQDPGKSNYTGYIESCIQGLLKESRDKFKGWVSVSGSHGTDLAYKKVGDGHPLRLWKCSVDVEAPPVEVLNRILRERHLWDEDLLKWRVVTRLDQDAEVFQYISNAMAPHPTRDFVEIRSWKTDLARGACVLVSTSVEHQEAPLIGGVRGVVLASRYLMEPCGTGKSRLTYICRIDLRGHTPEWYNKVYGHICANYVSRIKASFTQGISQTSGPETKV